MTKADSKGQGRGAEMAPGEEAEERRCSIVHGAEEGELIIMCVSWDSILGQYTVVHAVCVYMQGCT